jgi:ABC-type polysaccharide/polyol phosphate export permease
MKQKISIYDSTRRVPLALEELMGVLQYRDLIFQLVQRDILARYKRSILGVAWTMLNPLGMMIVLTVVFSRLFHTIEGYPIYVFSGLLAWTFFAQATTSSMQQMVWGSALLHRIYIPRTIFAVSAIGTGLVNLTLSLAPLTLLMLITAFPLRWSMLFLPVVILLLGAFALGIGLLISSMAIYFPDVTEMYQVALVAWMYLTPIIYPPEIIPEAYRGWILGLNPMYYLVQLFRMVVYDGVLPPWPILLTCLGIAISTLLFGWVVFSWKSDEFTYRI